MVELEAWVTGDDLGSIKQRSLEIAEDVLAFFHQQLLAGPDTEGRRLTSTC